MTLINTLLPLFLLIGLGFVAVRLRWLPAEGVAPMGAMVVRLALPALIFLALAGAPPAEALNFPLLSAYAAGSLATMGLCLGVARLVLRLDWPVCAVVVLGVALANSGFMGFAISQALMDFELAGRLLAHCMLVENVLVIPLALALMALVPGGSGANPWAGLVRNPLLGALLAGLAVSFLGLSLPVPVRTAVEMLARISAPVALLVIGGILATLPVSGRLGSVGLLVVGKLALHPLLVWGAVSIVPGAEPALATGLILFAAMPMVTIFPLLAARAGQGQFAAMGLMTATLGSFATLPLVIRVLGLA